MHLHSPWSHDACDGEPLDEDGEPRLDCLLDLRQGLCRAGIEHAFLSDHPAWFATGEWEEVPLAQPGDTLLAGGSVLSLPCDDGRPVLWYPGVEDEVMPVALDQHVPGDSGERDALYNRSDSEALDAFAAAGGRVFVNHTEGRSLDELTALVQGGAVGVEAFNLHAAFAPDIRAEDLGLDPVSWLSEIAPFTAPDGTGQPDLFVLAVLADQEPSLQAWDSLQAVATDDRVVVGIAGTDAHQNVLPLELRDGERGDSYRRMLRWFSQHLWIDGDASDPAAAEQALAQGRFHVVFEILGTPVGFDFHLEDASGTVHEMGSVLAADQLPATLVLTCPSLWEGSPQGTAAPVITGSVLKDGRTWQEGCGSFTVDEPGSYRVRVDLSPAHLEPFLGGDPQPWIHPYPWILGNPIRVRD